jgi:hypoxanthine phosphoribosyltransferase
MSKLHPDLKQIIVSEEDIQKRVKEMATQIEKDYADAERIILVGVLKGAFIFLADLARALTKEHIVDFIAVSSYGKSGAVAGAVRLVLDMREPIVNEHVIIVEDIVDSGHTLDYLHHTLQGRQPASLKTCALIEKKRDKLTVPVDYLGFDIPDVWVVGYGLDYAERYRTLPFVAELNPEAYS